MSVERFEPSGGGGQGAAYYEMDKASDGEWVRFEDYEKLHKELDTLSARFTALIQQNNTMAAENERLSEKLPAMESQNKGEYEYSNEYRDGVIRGYHLGQYGDDVMLAHILMHASDENLPEPLPVPADKPARITEQDAREIAGNVMEFNYDHKHSVDYWMREEGYYLLNKLNADREQLPAVAVPEYVTVSQVPNSKYAEGWNDCVDSMLAAAPSHSQQSASTDDLSQRLLGRAEFLRDRGEIKTPELLERAANAIR